jgi:hypothetical protein
LELINQKFSLIEISNAKLMFDSVDDNSDGWEGDERGDAP